MSIATCVPPSATIPTYVVPRLHSALVATDLSAFANRAVPFAFALTDEGGEVHIAPVVDDDAEVDETEIKRQLITLAPAHTNRSVAAHLVRGDDAAKAISQAAARLGCDAICIASHGRSGISACWSTRLTTLHPAFGTSTKTHRWRREMWVR